MGRMAAEQAHALPVPLLAMAYLHYLPLPLTLTFTLTLRLPRQEQLYYLVAPSRESALASAYMEALKAKDLEVG